MNTVTAVAHILSCHEQLSKTRLDALAAADVLDGSQAGVLADGSVTIRR